MTTRFDARLTFAGSFAQHDFQSADLLSTLLAAAPQRLGLCFDLSATGKSTLHIRCEFAAPETEPEAETDRLGNGVYGSAAERAQLCRENLLRGDLAGRYDCLFVSDTQHPVNAASAAQQPWRVQPPDDAALPSGQWFALPASLLTAAAALFRHAQANQFAFGYSVELSARAADPALARRLVPALAALATRGRHPELEDALRDAVACISAPGWQGAERLWLPQYPGVAAGLQRLALRELRATTPFLPTDFWEVLEVLELQTNTEPPETPAWRVFEARDDDVLGLLFRTLLPDTPASPSAATTRQVALSAQAGDYAFISYAHAERGYAQQLIDALVSAGVRVWFDQGIEAGMVWDATLEERIRSAGAVIVCVNQRYEQSRYCTRELKFADLLKKPIFPVAPTAWVWGEGLQLMFQELQIGQFAAGSGATAFAARLRAAVPGVFQ